MTTQKNALKNSFYIMIVLMTVLLLSANGSAVTEIYLRADTTLMTMPDGRLIEMWGFAQDSAFEAHDGTVSVPGPQIVVDSTETQLIIHLENNLPEPVSVIIPGQRAAVSPVSFTDDTGRDRIRSFTHETPSNNNSPVDYEWNDLRCGTFLYQSGSHPAVQVQMGLYGCLKKDFSDGAVKQAYDGITYDEETVLVFSEIDPALHDAVSAGNYGPDKPMTSTIEYAPRYYLVNGQAFTPAQAPIAVGQVDQTVLLRLVNAGIQSHVPVLQYLRGSVVAEDGFAYTYPRDLYAIDLPPAKTSDVLVVPQAAGTYLLYDHALSLTNDTALGGGMMVRLDVAAAAPPQPVMPLEVAAEPMVVAAAAQTPAAADMDSNGIVNYKDVFLFIRYWHARSWKLEDNPADLNNDGQVDDRDVTMMMEEIAGSGRDKKQSVPRRAVRPRAFGR